MRDFEKYEKLVSCFVEAKLMNGIPANKYEIFRQKKYIGKSGQPYIIDISTELDLNGIKYLTVIECKNYNKKIEINIINELFGRLNDIGAHKGVVVTTKGFQKGALKAATSFKISCVIANDLVWEPLVGDPFFILEQSNRLSNYVNKTTNKSVPDILNDNLDLFFPEFNSTNAFCETDKNGFCQFIDNGFTVVDENNQSFITSTNGLVNLLILIILNTYDKDNYC